MNEKVLIDCGLTVDQAKIYLLLLEQGLSNAKGISVKTGIGRALVYKVIEQLIDMKLVEKREDLGKIALFGPGHPSIIKNIIENRKKDINSATESINSIFGLLSSKYNALQGKPNINYLEGIEGIEYIYNDILDVSKDIKIISSPIKYEYRDKILEIIEKQTVLQAKNNIRTIAITPRDTVNKREIDRELDEKRLIQRKIIDIKELNIPAQIIMYGDKTAITNFKETVITVIIESKYITETFEKLFNYIWNKIEQ